MQHYLAKLSAEISTNIGLSSKTIYKRKFAWQLFQVKKSLKARRSRSRDISVATFLYIRNWWNLLTLFR